MRTIYFTEKEAKCLREVAGQWIELMETGEEDLITPMLEGGLGSALAKLYKGKNGYQLFEEYVKKERSVKSGREKDVFKKDHKKR